MDPYKQAVRGAFGGAVDYDDHANVQREAAYELSEQIARLPLRPGPRICEIGCGVGTLGAALLGALSRADFLLTDLSQEMLARAQARLGRDPRVRFAVVDADAPDGLDGEEPFDVICSSFAAQWFLSLPGALERLLAHVRPGGWLVVTTLVEGTFAEWIQAHKASGLKGGTLTFPALSRLRRLRPLGEPVRVEHRVWQESFADGPSFLRALRAIGATTPARGHAPLNVKAMRQVLRAFESSGAQITYEMATCWVRRAGWPVQSAGLGARR